MLAVISALLALIIVLNEQQTLKCENVYFISTTGYTNDIFSALFTAGTVVRRAAEQAKFESVSRKPHGIPPECPVQLPGGSGGNVGPQAGLTPHVEPSMRTWLSDLVATRQDPAVTSLDGSSKVISYPFKAASA